ncbi:MAG: ribonuclease H-like domain-containing protein [Gammaproteobacteria bacterium]
MKKPTALGISRSGDARNPHVFQYTLRFLRSGGTRPSFARDGFFTNSQLSYTCRPRRRPKHLRDKREKYHHALRALAIRLQKIHIVGQPQLTITGTPIYLDVEALPDREFYYLIGAGIDVDDSFMQRSFWADDFHGENGIWSEFLSMLAGIQNPLLIHYGSFEATFFKRMVERYGEPPEGSSAAKAIASSVNLVSFLFAQVYFPTYSNRLKEFGSYLGFRWSSTNPSGTQSIIWRTDWERSGDLAAKQNLILYNAEDCQALHALTRTLLRIVHPDDQQHMKDGTAPEVASADSSASREGLWRKFSSPIVAFQVINKAARWDFQRDRIYIRTDKGRRRTASAIKTRVKRPL